ncbi:hypothetical protein [Streptomyces sp. NPDC048172]|uniref:hypothetical protein n=1 Tax=Streptomyces sp. NPDC048172 TaxID=3365505 RepID=UPI00371C5C72
MSERPGPRPLLMLDVDGPLNPFATRFSWLPLGYTTHLIKPPSLVARYAPAPAASVPPYRVRLRAEHGALLRALPYELVWATAWAHEANEFIAPVLGLPPLPVVEWPQDAGPELDGLLWKTRHIVAWADGRPFAWVDDAITRRERRYVAAHHDGPALLHQVSARRGLRRADFDALAAWAAGR